MGPQAPTTQCATLTKMYLIMGILPIEYVQNLNYTMKMQMSDLQKQYKKKRNITLTMEGQENTKSNMPTTKRKLKLSLL